MIMRTAIKSMCHGNEGCDRSTSISITDGVFLAVFDAARVVLERDAGRLAADFAAKSAGKERVVA